MTENYKQTANRCKRFVNFIKILPFLANYCAIYMNPRKNGQKTKEEEKWEWQSTMKMT